MFKYGLMLRKGMSASVLKMIILALVVGVILLLIVWGIKNNALG